MPIVVTLPAQEHQVRIHAPPAPGPGKDVVRGGIKGQRAPAVADASAFLEETGMLVRPLPLVVAGEEATG